MIKETCNARDKARMVKLAKRGLSVRAIGATLKISEACIKRNMKGQRVAKDLVDIAVDTEVIGEDEVEVTPETETPAPVKLTPAQKAAATKKANAAKKAGKPAEDAAADPDFLE